MTRATRSIGVIPAERRRASHEVLSDRAVEVASSRAEEIMSDGEVRYLRDGAVATVIFDRPASRNAMTWRMYEQLGAACARMQQEAGLRVAVFRGAGGKAFIAGTDIGQFQAFRTAEDGIAYEAKMDGYIEAIEALPVPTLAVIQGFAVGGGLAIAAACDLRIATPGSRFGVPIARTLGNCLSIANYARLVAALGTSRAKRVLLLAENISAEEAQAGGFLSEIVQPSDIDRRVGELTARLAQHAPLSMRVSKEALRRLLHAGLPNADDLVRVCYGSDDFRAGVEAFVEKREPQWTGK
jgi:enoyl-CoA hydratase/carnithine racemase